MAGEGATGMTPMVRDIPSQAWRRGASPCAVCGMGLGTWVVIEASGCSAGCALAGPGGAFARIRQIEECMHPERQGSDLLRLRQAPRGYRASPSIPGTWAVLNFAQQLFELSGGVFDPCLPHSAGRLCDLELSPDGTSSRGHAHMCR